jgi:hypothetical protein
MFDMAKELIHQTLKDKIILAGLLNIPGGNNKNKRFLV